MDASLLLVSRNLCFFSSLIWLSYFLFFLNCSRDFNFNFGFVKREGSIFKVSIEIYSPPSLTTKRRLWSNNICLKCSYCILLPHLCPNDYLIQPTIHPPIIEELDFNSDQNTKGLQWVNLKIILNFKKIKSSVRCLKFLIFRTFVLSVSCPK